ncbi:DUF6882 domain-containing protein [Flammeovirga pacifica]|uniref:Uncharacterized protein n=1 Tax=Flammeovirga pacifica TaxID=915059 RepID=A0A1S1YWK2_FLAPC|nr:DUF6882 domain-containing protein [Flammeovirga pacifica]OHX65409.1 hypothetical protein NH26_03120 [Flammeovirga pacifica]
MGLKERRAIKAFQEEQYPPLKEQINQFAGFDLPLEVQWETMVEDRFAHLYHDTYVKIYFKPLIEALKAICIDDFGKNLLQAGVQKVVIKNEGNIHNPETGYTLENKILTINLDPVINADNMEPRISVLCDLLERKLAERGSSDEKVETQNTSTSANNVSSKAVIADTNQTKVSTDDLFNLHAATAYEQQNHCAEIIGDKKWDFNLLDGILRFGEEIEVPIQILGTYSPKQKTWLWGWGNTQSGIPDELLSTANQMRELGIANDIEEFTVPKISIETDPGHYYAMIASGVSNATAYFPVDFNGIKIYVLTNSELMAKKEETPTPIVISTFTGLIASMNVSHKSCLTAYLNQNGFAVEPAGNNLMAKRNNEEVFALFNLKGNLMKITNN